MIVLWLAAGVLAQPSGEIPPQVAGSPGEWFWPGSKQDPYTRQVEKKICKAIAVKGRASSEKSVIVPSKRLEEAEYWLAIQSMLMRYTQYVDFVTPMLAMLLKADDEMKRTRALQVLKRAFASMVVIFLIEGDER